jgi:hypothetical protein
MWNYSHSGTLFTSPSTFQVSETGTPVKVSAAADFCAPPGTNLDFGNGYQLQYPVMVKIPVKSTVDSDCFLLPQSGACHITTSTGTTNSSTPLGPQKQNCTTTAKMTPSTHPGATTNTNNNNNANTNTNTNTNTNSNKNTNTNTNTNANINTNMIINRQTIQNTVKINDEVNNVIRTTSQAATTTSPSSKGPLVDLETVRLGKSTFPSAEIRPLADVSPFQIIGGHVSLNSPSPNVYVFFAQITNNGVLHAVIVDLRKTASGIPGETLYHTDLGQTIIGTNPFTGKVDTASHITDLLLYNNNKSSVQFNDDSDLTMTIIYR